MSSYIQIQLTRMLCVSAVPIHAKDLPRGVLYRARLWCEVEAFLWGPRKSYALTKPHTSASANNKVWHSCRLREHLI